MGIFQDTLLGVRLFTKRDTFMNKEEVMNLVMWVKNFKGDIPMPAILKPEPLWTGKQILSMILPDINLSLLNSTFDKTLETSVDMTLKDTRVLIQNGEILSGMFDKNIVGNKANGLLHGIWLEYGPTAAIEFLWHTQLIIDNWLVGRGFSVGINDTIADTESIKEIKRILAEAKKDVQAHYNNAQQGTLDH